MEKDQHKGSMEGRERRRRGAHFFLCPFDQKCSAQHLSLWTMISISPQKTQRRTQKAQGSWEAGLN
jgi:hypothetical protein